MKTAVKETKFVAKCAKKMKETEDVKFTVKIDLKKKEIAIVTFQKKSPWVKPNLPTHVTHFTTKDFSIKQVD